MKNFFFLSFLTIASLFGSGCTTEAWYEGVKRSAEDNCWKLPPSAADECLSRVNKKTYPEYEKERTGNK